MKVNLFDSVLLGVGGMIGGGIFVLNGLLVHKNRNFSPISWIIGAIICLLVIFSYIILSLEYPSNEGTLKYPEKLIKNKKYYKIIGMMIIFGYLSLTTVYSLSLGEYVSNYFNKPHLNKYIAIITILFCQIINYFPAKDFIKIEDSTVILKILLFSILILYGLFLPSKNKIQSGKGNNLQSGNFISSIPSIIVLGFASFLSYEGFEMISNESKIIDNPKKNLPYSYLLSLLIVVIIYVSLTFVTNKHIGYKINESNRFSSLINLTKEYGFTRIGPILVIILCIIANVTAINSTMFTNEQIFKTYLDNIEKNKFITQINKGVKIPLFNEKRKKVMWLVSIISISLTFLPIVITTNLGSMSFLLIFAIVSYLGYKLVKIKEKEKNKINILNYNISYTVSKSITLTALILCLLGFLILLMPRKL